MRTIDISFLYDRPGFGNLLGLAYDPVRNLFYLSHSSCVGAKVSVIYVLDFNGQVVNEWDFTELYGEVLEIETLCYDRGTDHLLIGVAKDMLTKSKLHVVECSVDGESIFSDVELDYSLGKITIDGPYIWATDFKEDRIICFSRKGVFQTEYSLSKSFGGYPGPDDLTISYNQGFFIVDHYRKLIIEFDKAGNELNAYTTATLGDGRGFGIVSDLDSRQLYLSVNNEQIFIISDNELSKLQAPGPDNREPDLPIKPFNIDLTGRPPPSKTNWTKAKAKKFVMRLLDIVRTEVTRLDLDRDKLPGWINFSNICFGWMWDTLIVAIDDSSFGKDKSTSLSTVNADTVVLLRCDNFIPKSIVWKVYEDTRDLTIKSGGNDDDPTQSCSRPTFVIAEDSAFLACGFVQGHGPIIVIDICYRIDGSKGIKSMRIVPVALYLTWQDYLNQDKTIDFFKKRMVTHVHEVTMSAKGTVLKAERQRNRVFEATKQKTVIILGSYDEPHLDELAAVRDYIGSKNYDGKLIVDFPNIRGESSRQKAGKWMSAARFSVMIDREPSGHLIEYSQIENQKSVLCLLRPQGHKSTSMIADHIEESAFIKLFEFDQSPLEILDVALDWAEEHVKQREAKN